MVRKPLVASLVQRNTLGPCPPVLLSCTLPEYIQKLFGSCHLIRLANLTAVADASEFMTSPGTSSPSSCSWRVTQGLNTFYTIGTIQFSRSNSIPTPIAVQQLYQRQLHHTPYNASTPFCFVSFPEICDCEPKT